MLDLSGFRNNNNRTSNSMLKHSQGSQYIGSRDLIIIITCVKWPHKLRVLAKPISLNLPYFIVLELDTTERNGDLCTTAESHLNEYLRFFFSERDDFGGGSSSITSRWRLSASVSWSEATRIEGVRGVLDYSIRFSVAYASYMYIKTRGFSCYMCFIPQRPLTESCLEATRPCNKI